MNLSLELYKLKIRINDFKRDYIPGSHKYTTWLMNDLTKEKEKLDVGKHISFKINVSGSLFIMTDIIENTPIAIKEISNKEAKHFSIKDRHDLIFNRSFV